MHNLTCTHCNHRITVRQELPSDKPFRFTCPQCGEKTTVQRPVLPASEKIVISFDEPTPPPLPSGGSAGSQSTILPPPPPVPGTSASAFSGNSGPAPGVRLSPRQRRLVSDEKETQEFFRDFPMIRIVSSKGTPADTYVVEYHIRGIERLEKNQPVYRDTHQVEIQLGSGYPRTPPTCRMLTPIFHPNIEPAVICIGDHWSAQERLCHLIVRIGEIICFQSYNIHSPLDGLAAQWADLHQDMLPTDSRFLMP